MDHLQGQHTLEPYSDGLTATELVGWFGVDGSVSQRAATMLSAINVSDGEVTPASGASYRFRGCDDVRVLATSPPGSVR